MRDSYYPYSPTPITSISDTGGSGVVIVAGTPALTPGNPTYTIYIKWARLRIRSITNGAIVIGGDTAATSPVIVKGVDVGVYELVPVDGIGIALTDNKGLYYTASGSNLDYTIEVGLHRVINSLG